MKTAAGIQDEAKFAFRPSLDNPIFPYDSFDQIGP
jgi:hypothetical protein